MAKIEHIFENLTNGATYYGKVFTVNPKKRVNNRADLMVFAAVPALGLDLVTMPEGTIVMINESGAPVPFYVAKHDYESGLNGEGRTLLVRKDIHSNRVWNSGSGSVYAGSDIDVWFNDTYIYTLDSKVRSAIGTTKFKNAKGSGDYTITTVQRGVFALSATEFGMGSISYYPDGEGETLPIANTLKIAYLNGTAANHWMRTPWVGNANAAGFVNKSGKEDGVATNSSQGARPCFTLPADTKLSMEPNADGSYSLL